MTTTVSTLQAKQFATASIRIARDLLADAAKDGDKFSAAVLAQADKPRIWTVRTKRGSAKFAKLAHAYRVALRDGGQIFTDGSLVTVTRGKDGERYTLTARWTRNA